MTETAKASFRSEEKAVRVTRSRRNVAWSGIGAIVVIVALFAFPYYVGPGTTGIMVQGLIVLTLASMWNLLAGYAGLVSVGQQAFFGLGAYTTVLLFANHHLNTWLAVVLGCALAGASLLDRSDAGPRYWASANDLAPGTVLTSSDLTLVRGHLAG